MNKTVKVILGLILAFSLAATVQPSWAVDGYQINQANIPNTMYLDMVDTFSDTGEGASFLVANTPRPGENMPDEHLCQGFGAAPCDFKSGTNMWGNLIAPACQTENQTNCIDSLSVYKADETPTKAKFIRQAEGETIKADPKHNLTEGSTRSLWQASHNHTGSNGDYVAFVQLTLGYNSSTEQVQITTVNTSVMPVTIVSGAYQPIKYTQGITPEGRKTVGSSSGPSNCVWLESNSCGRLQDFAPDTRVSLSIRVQDSVGGWFKGRMKAPNIEVKPLGNNSNLITFDAEPVNVPQFYARFDVNGGDPGVNKWLQTLTYKPQNGGGQNVRSDYPNAFDIVDNFRGITKDTAAGVSTLWSAGTLPSGSNSCLADRSKVLGIVTTNSMAYQGGSPVFSEGALSYKVAGLHYLPDGKTEVEGSYDLVMRSETARCLYGFSKAPISATVSVTSSDGASKVATTVVRETKDGWLKLAAYGFTFSENRIKATITQAGSAKKTTITCVNIKNKKLTKKVTAVAPKCPAGYKKKS
jgi:hypothetical protein